MGTNILALCLAVQMAVFSPGADRLSDRDAIGLPVASPRPPQPLTADAIADVDGLDYGLPRKSFILADESSTSPLERLIQAIKDAFSNLTRTAPSAPEGGETQGAPSTFEVEQTQSAPTPAPEMITTSSEGIDVFGSGRGFSEKLRSLEQDIAQGKIKEKSIAYDRLPLLPQPSQRVISPDAERLHLASTKLLDREPTLDASLYRPDVGARFNEDGSLTLRVLVGNSSERLTAIGDFNNWGDTDNLAAYQLQPTASNPKIHEVTFPPGDYHKNQYRLLDNNGQQRLDLGAALFSTPAFNDRFDIKDRPDDNLNAVFWKPTPVPAEELAEPVDLRGQQLSIGEIDIVSLALKWVCNNPDSAFAGTTGADHISQLYNFVSECGLPQQMADWGYNAIEFMPLDSHVDFWEPGAPYFPDWRYSYQTLSFYGKHADFGSPDELKNMINTFHQAEVAVILDVVYSHYSERGNNPPREFATAGFSTYHRDDGWELYGGPYTEWGTRRFTYSPEIRNNIIDAALVNILDYGFDGLRIDNVNGIEQQPDGRQFLRELTKAVALYQPRAVVIGEGYFGDNYLNRSWDVGGAGLLTTYSDRFYLWFTEEIIKYRDEIDTWRLDYMLSNDWPLVMLYYPGNHDEFANPGNPFQTRGRYLAEAIDGGFHNRKIQSWSALNLFTSSYYLDMPQLWTLQPGNLNDNAPVDWSRLEEDPEAAQIVELQSDMKKFYLNNPAFAPYNVHRHMLHWIDHDNKVVVFERIDFASGRRTYAVVNLGDRAIANYKIPVYPEEAKFEIALDSDRPLYGGEGRNGDLVEVSDRQLEFFLGSYAVVGLVQQSNLQPIPEEELFEENFDRPDYSGYGYSAFAGKN